MSARKAFRCIGIGEILWDLLPSGNQLGGAPANFACHAHALGMDADIISRIGNDILGRDILTRLRGLNLSTRHLQVDESAPTGIVEVKLSGNGIPHYVIRENVAWDRIGAIDATLEAVSKADAICFGSLAQRREPSRSTIQRLVGAAPANALRVFDINLRQNFFSRELIEQSLGLANVLKLNDQELPVLAALFGLGDSTFGQIEALARQFELRLVALTRGPEGSLLFSCGRWSERRGVAVTVKDTVGAGDSFTAALTVGMLRGMDLDEVNALANEIASYVCSCAGATPPLPAHLRDAAGGHAGTLRAHPVRLPEAGEHITATL